jgi:hypothetical protein
MDDLGKVCAYVNIQNGLVYPCDPGCCGGKCNKTVTGVRFHIDASKRSDILPVNFNINLPHSDNPSNTPGSAPFQPLSTGSTDGSTGITIHPIIDLLIFPAILLLIVIFAAFSS